MADTPQTPETPDLWQGVVDLWRQRMYPHHEPDVFARYLADLSAEGWDDVRREVTALKEICALTDQRRAEQIAALTQQIEQWKTWAKTPTRHGGNHGIPFYLQPDQRSPEYDQGDAVIVWYDDLYDLAQHTEKAEAELTQLRQQLAEREQEKK